jgi:guanylate kinase
MTRKPVVVVLHGPAGVGKDAVVDRLRERSAIKRATSCTTRAPREGERHGVHYYFLSHEEFQRGIAAGDFAEWAWVYDDLKGLWRSEIEGPVSRGEDLIIRTDVQGARTWRDRLEGAVFIFLMAEDREAIRARLIGRNSESEESLARRMEELEAELADIPNNDYLVINRHEALDAAVDEIEAIVAREREDPRRPVPRLRERPAELHGVPPVGERVRGS